uniref:toprim domain-containing protein n=1 Tax=Succinivibrio sp. TaxID=2053619 RepID=UPI00402A758E
MGKSLVIVESPSKATIIKRYLGDDYVVRASVGHNRALANGSSSKAETADGNKVKLTKEATMVQH